MPLGRRAMANVLRPPIRRSGAARLSCGSQALQRLGHLHPAIGLGRQPLGRAQGLPGPQRPFPLFGGDLGVAGDQPMRIIVIGFLDRDAAARDRAGRTAHRDDLGNRAQHLCRIELGALVGPRDLDIATRHPPRRVIDEGRGDAVERGLDLFRAMHHLTQGTVGNGEAGDAAVVDRI